MSGVAAPLELWWVKAVPLEKAPSGKPSWADVADGTLVGVIRVGAAWSDIRGYGMFGAIDLASDGAPGRRGHAFQKKLFDNGLHLKATGDSLIVAPPLIAEREHIDGIVAILRKTLASL